MKKTDNPVENAIIIYIDAFIVHNSNIQQETKQLEDEDGYETDTCYAPIANPPEVSSYMPSGRPNWIGYAIYLSHARMGEVVQKYNEAVGQTNGTMHFVFTSEEVTCDFCMKCEACKRELAEVERHPEWAPAWDNWTKNNATYYETLTNPLQPYDERMFAWKIWMQKK